MKCKKIPVIACCCLGHCCKSNVSTFTFFWFLNAEHSIRFGSSFGFRFDSSLDLIRPFKKRSILPSNYLSFFIPFIPTIPLSSFSSLGVENVRVQGMYWCLFNVRFRVIHVAFPLLSLFVFSSLSLSLSLQRIWNISHFSLSSFSLLFPVLFSSLDGLWVKMKWGRSFAPWHVWIAPFVARLSLPFSFFPFLPFFLFFLFPLLPFSP